MSTVPEEAVKAGYDRLLTIANEGDRWFEIKYVLDSELIPAIIGQARKQERERVREALEAKVKEAEQRVAGESPKERHERLKELLGGDWPVMTMMRDIARSSPPWAWWMENGEYDHDKYEVEHYIPLSVLDMEDSDG